MKVKNTLKDLIYFGNDVLTIAQRAERIGVHRATIHNILAGKQVSLLTVKKVCRYYGVDWRDYVED